MYKIIRLPEVMQSTGLARSTIYKKMVAGEFPKAISLGSKSVGWLESEVQQWIEQRIPNLKEINSGDAHDLR
ncbi:MAG: helix-turn-helix transcriptional regulator [Chitinophagaceae bacterium]